MQRLLSQQPLLLQVCPAQHAWPAPPHVTHTRLEQPSPALQESPAQHACPEPPHGEHVLFWHDTPGAVHVPPLPPFMQHA